MSGHERERLSAYLDGELPPVERSAVTAHLSACPECAAFLADLAAVDEAAASLPVQAPEGYFETFPARVRSRLETPKAGAPRRRVPAWTWAAAAALLLAVVTPLTLRQWHAASGEAPAAAPVAFPAAPSKGEPERAEEARPPEPSSKAVLGGSPTASARSAAPAPPPAPGDTLRAALPAPEAAHEVPRDEVVQESRFAREPSAPLPAAAPVRDMAAPVTLADPESSPTAGGAAREAAGTLGKGGRERLHPAAVASTAESVAPAPSAAKANAAVEDRLGGEETFRRLDAVRPRSAVEWRTLRDEWNALARAEPDRTRADEARVRAILAGREAWLASGSADDESAFRSAAAAYLQREDALQRPRVEGLLGARPAP
jgi:hypothetical protein